MKAKENPLNQSVTGNPYYDYLIHEVQVVCIPNHPHCRCRWVAILSGLGIKNRQKAALDQYGDLYYTKAASYDEYAKEVGLPSVKDMVNADNPKKYLRPGETLADLNRQVVRKRFNGQIITVPLGLLEPLQHTRSTVDFSVKRRITHTRNTTFPRS